MFPAQSHVYRNIYFSFKKKQTSKKKNIKKQKKLKKKNFKFAIHEKKNIHSYKLTKGIGFVAKQTNCRVKHGLVTYLMLV